MRSPCQDFRELVGGRAFSTSDPPFSCSGPSRSSRRAPLSSARCQELGGALWGKSCLCFRTDSRSSDGSAPSQVSLSSRDRRWDIVTALLFPAEILWWRRLEPRPVSGAGSFPLLSCKLLQNTKNTQNISQTLLVRASNCCNCHGDVIYLELGGKMVHAIMNGRRSGS